MDRLDLVGILDITLENRHNLQMIPYLAFWF